MGCWFWIKKWAVGVMDFWLIHKKNISWKNILGKSSNYHCIPVKIWHNLMIIGSIYEHQEKWSYFPRYFRSRKLHIKPNTAKRAHPEGSIFWNRTFFRRLSPNDTHRCSRARSLLCLFETNKMIRFINGNHVLMKAKETRRKKYNMKKRQWKNGTQSLSNHKDQMIYRSFEIEKYLPSRNEEEKTVFFVVVVSYLL